MHTQKGFSNLVVIICGVLFLALIGLGIVSLRKAMAPSLQDVLSRAIPSPEGTTRLSSLFASSTIIGRAGNLDAIGSGYGVRLTQAQANYLEKNKFLLVPIPLSLNGYNFDGMLAYFDSIGGSPDKYYRAQDNTKLVTPDIVLQAYHDYFDLSLSELERTELSSALHTFLIELTDNILKAKQSAEISSAALAPLTVQRYQNLYAQMTVARVLLENAATSTADVTADADAQATDRAIDTASHAQSIFNTYAIHLPKDIVDSARAELNFIYDAKDVTDSPLWKQYTDTGESDYTQFTPRSHYTKNSRLRAYFRAMMYLGRNSYLFSKDVGIQDAHLMAAMFSRQARDGGTPETAWKRIMDVTGFYAGQSDDITYMEWRTFLNATIGTSAATSRMTLSSASVSSVRAKLNMLRGPRIFSDAVIDESIWSKTKADLLKESMGLRVFGQKFTFDAWVLADLIAGQEKTPIRLPSMPSALFVPAALGDARARMHAQEFLTKESGFSPVEITGFLSKLDEKIAQLKNVKSSEWLGSLGSAWLDVLSTLTHTYGSAYPMYMQSSVFSDKQIQTFMGSYTELKHDTLLYAKQNYAEKGGGGDQPPALPPVVKGFVEPNMDFWKKLLALIDRTEHVFKSANVFQNSSALSRLREFGKIVAFYQSIAQKELNNTPITEAEYETLRTTNLYFMATPFDPNAAADENSGRTALVADIHTDTIQNKVLYEAIGEPYLMIAYVDSESSPRLVLGPVFNHYEFTQAIGKRLNDEDWKATVYDHAGSMPQKNFWYQSLFTY